MKITEFPTTARRPKYTKRIIHPAAAIAEPLQGEAFDAFVDVLDRYGDVGLDPIVAVRWPEPDGHVNGTIAILSGQTNLAACEKLGREPRIEIYSGSQPPAELAVSLNLLHPHLSTDQRAAIGVEIAEQIAIEAKKRQKAAGGDRKSLLSKVTKAIDPPTAAQPGDDQADPAALHARDYAARIVAVSSGYIWRAQTVRDRAPGEFAKLKAGKLKLGKAFQETRRNQKRESMAPLRRNLASARPGAPHDIHAGDCLALLPTLPRRAYRLVFADSPYNIGVDYGKGSKADRLPEPKFLTWCERWIGELPELLTPDGAAVLLIDQPHLFDFGMIARRTKQLHLRSLITWYEPFGNNCSDKFNRTSRYLLYLVRDPKRFVFNHDKLNRPSDRQVKYNDLRANPGGKLLDDVWFDIPRLTGTSAQRIPDFPTQLPEQLLQRIVEGLSEPGDSVLDPFCGSGTTAAVCARTGRSCWSCDINPDYVEQARARVLAITKGVKL